MSCLAAQVRLKSDQDASSISGMLDFSDAPPFGRVEGLKRALQMVEKKSPQKPFIIETGTSRGDLGGGIQGDGQATVAFAWYCSKKDGKIWTIDIEKEAIDNCRKLTESFKDWIEYFVEDSVSVLERANQPIDLLYLDSANDPDLALKECKAAEKNITSETIIIIDDSSIKAKRPGGVNKGIFVFKYLFDKGWDVVFDDGNQIIMIDSKKQRSGVSDSLLSMYYDWKVKRIYRRAVRKGAV